MRARAAPPARERVAQHVALAAALLEADCSRALQLVAQVAHAVLGAPPPRRSTRVARDQRLGQQPLRFAPSPRAAPRAATSISSRARSAAAIRSVSSRWSCSSRRHSASVAAARSRSAASTLLRLRRAGLGRFAGRARLRRPPRRARPAAGCPRRDRARPRRGPARSRPCARRPRPAPARPGCARCRAPRPCACRRAHLLLGRREVVAHRDQVLLGGVDALLERRASPRRRRPRASRPSCPRSRASRRSASTCSCRAEISRISRRGASRPLTPRPPSTIEPRRVSPASVTQATGPWRDTMSSASSSVSTTSASGSAARMRRGVGTGHTVDVAEQPARARLLRGHVAQDGAVRPRARARRGAGTRPGRPPTPAGSGSRGGRGRRPA